MAATPKIARWAHLVIGESESEAGHPQLDFLARGGQGRFESKSEKKEESSRRGGFADGGEGSRMGEGVKRVVASERKRIHALIL